MGIFLFAAAIVVAALLAPAMATPGEPPGPTPGVSGQMDPGLATPDYGGNPADEDRTVNRSLLASIRELIDNLQELFRDGLFGAFVRFIGYLMDALLYPVMGVFGRNFLYTQPLIGQEWVKTWWNWLLLLSLLADGFAVAMLGYRFLAGASVNSSPNRPETAGAARAVLLAVVLGFFSLWLAELAVNLQNHAWETAAMEPVSRMAVAMGYVSPVSLTNLDGSLILKAPFAHTEMASAMGAAVPAGGIPLLADSRVSEVILGNNPLGNLVPMMLSMLSFVSLGVFALIRFWLIRGLAAAAPLWLTISALSGTVEPIVGYLNLFGRTILLQSLFAAAWLAAYHVGAVALGDTGGASPAFLPALMLAATVFAAYRLWAKTVAQAVRQPVTLGGGAVLAATGASVERVSAAMGMVADRFGWAEWASASIRTREWAGRVKETGARWQEAGPGPASGRASPVQAVKDYAGRMASTRGLQVPGRVDKVPLVTVEENIHAVAGGGDLAGWVGLRVPAGKREDLLDELADPRRRLNVPADGFRADPDDPDRLLVWRDHLDRVRRVAEKVLSGHIPYWEYRGKFVVLENGIPAVTQAPPPSGLNMGKWKGIGALRNQ